MNILHPFTLRIIGELFTKRVEPDTAEIGNHKIVDISDLVENVPGKGTRKPDSLLGACMHVTGVKGGYGTSGSQRKWAERQLEDKTPWCRDLVADTDEDAVVKVAIRGRHGGQFRSYKGVKKGTPYHFIRTAQGEWLQLNSRLCRTWHGNGANSRFDGVAFDGLWKSDPPDPVEVMDMRAFLAAVLRSGSHLESYNRVTAHRCYSSQRLGDPGLPIWKHVVMPIVRELGLEVHSVAVGSGRKIPQSWMGNILRVDKFAGTGEA